MRELLEQMKEYIESCEETFSAGFGGGLVAVELIDAGMMPQVYDNVLFALSKS